ncbi:MAG TPA: DUF5678 domain-containing protein [Ilumatobacter sp.]|nr:DUF5678 domain-containing protein [Ilumatobacter sp.]
MSSTVLDLEKYRGKWVAVDPSGGVVVEAAETHEALLQALEHQPGRKVVIHRVPVLDEPIFVGLG